MHDLVLAAALMLGTTAPATEPSATAADDAGTALPAIDDILVTAPSGAPAYEHVSLDELAQQRGGASYIVNNQTLLGVVEGNVIGGDYVAGPVALSDNALSNFNGLLAISINTGLQSNIISGMAVTINLSE